MECLKHVPGLSGGAISLKALFTLAVLSYGLMVLCPQAEPLSFGRGL
jgi:hypothetical protein